MGFGLRRIQDSLTFPAPRSSYSLVSHPELFFIPKPNAPPSCPGVPCMLYAVPQGAPVLLVHVHSNGCDVGDMRQTLASISESLSIHVMSFEYPGYGLHLGAAGMKSIDDTTLVVLDFIMNTLKVDIGQVVWYGRSIGSGPSIRIAQHITKVHKRQPGGLVVQCGYASFPDVAGHLFGRVAKRLVQPLWPNEVMVRDLNCPVLIIHGKGDTMIPIEHSERLWKAVNRKEASSFLAFDCGHNDIPFRQCTLQPIYDFLFNIITATDPPFPMKTLQVEIPANFRACVRHVGPLRQRIPAYGFRRAELEDWMRQKLPLCRFAEEAEGATPLTASASSATLGSPSGEDGTSTSAAGRPTTGMSGRNLCLDKLDGQEQAGTASRTQALTQGAPGAGAAGVSAGEAAATAGSVSSVGQKLGVAPPQPPQKEASLFPDAGGSASPSGPSPAATAAGKGPSASAKTPTKHGKQSKAKIKDADKQLPPIPDFSSFPAPEGIRAALLDPEGMVKLCTRRVAAYLERMLQHLDVIEDLETKSVEDVVDLFEAEFWACDPLLCVWEEVQMCKGGRVRIRFGPFSVDNTGATAYEPELGGSAESKFGPNAKLLRVPLWVFGLRSSHFRCLAEWGLLHSRRLHQSLEIGAPAQNKSCVPCRRSSSKKNSKTPDAQGSPGMFATWLAAYFVQSVFDRTDGMGTVIQRFMELYENPRIALSGQSRLPPGSGLEPVPPQPPAPMPPAAVPPSVPAAMASAVASEMWHPDDVLAAQEAGNLLLPPREFVPAARGLLQDCQAQPSPRIAEFYASLWSPSDAGVSREPLAIPELAEIDEGLITRGPDRCADWSAAFALLHYDRRCREAVEASSVDADKSSRSIMNSDVAQAGAVMRKLMHIVCQIGARERREMERQRRLAAARLAPLVVGGDAEFVADGVSGGAPEEELVAEVAEIDAPGGIATGTGGGAGAGVSGGSGGISGATPTCGAASCRGL
eukprot:TRINITY_DN16727_c0_g2_i2.p1 TRINITY_DN16727_c0_g2~~TRINITY_DN16727_c0_g2_i2.p1  ORF type:complete len:976 (-),score=171.63 TRINITY_DN16727_c0_g2_i2:120-3047(-)